MARARDWLGMRLVRWGLALISDRRAYWLHREMQSYYLSPEGRATLQEIGR